ncbi:phage tail protein [Metasolibacillus sp. FSL K6-0083]|uniref:phage tail-collar fiber domain-containing protein n=1 Tax=Metasolibacillus sp. FSL K6-0083 TaxID=2921416 RepID=UPI003159AF57
MAQYGTIITNSGLAQIANAQATQTKVGLEYIALGDGNGAHYIPTQNQSALVNEVWRGPVANVTIDPTNKNRIIVDGVIPTNAGGFTIREIGVFDDQNQLIAVGQYPEKYKPQLSEGTVEEILIHFVLETNNSDIVELSIDPSIIIASRKYVDEKVENIEQRFIEHLDDRVGNLNKLTTEDKLNLVAAINSVRQNVTTHTNDSTRHITSSERTIWNSFGEGKLNKQVMYMLGGVSIDPNTTVEGTILTNHNNVPDSRSFYYIVTLFYNGVTPSSNRAQLAIHYNNNDIAMRSYYNGSWTSWLRVGDARQLLTNQKETIVGAINELFTSVSNGKSLVANAITQKGVATNPSAEFATMATNITQINTGRKFVTGNRSVNGDTGITVSGLGFTPSLVLFTKNYGLANWLDYVIYTSTKNVGRGLNSMTGADSNGVQRPTLANITVGNGYFNIELFSFTPYTGVVSWIAFE